MDAGSVTGKARGNWEVRWKVWFFFFAGFSLQVSIQISNLQPFSTGKTMDLCSLGNLIGGQPVFLKQQELTIISSWNSLNSSKSKLISVVIVQLSFVIRIQKTPQSHRLFLKCRNKKSLKQSLRYNWQHSRPSDHGCHSFPRTAWLAISRVRCSLRCSDMQHCVLSAGTEKYTNAFFPAREQD